MKKHFNTPDSMDLLLDAMCNVFGAVMLAAIIIGGTAAGKYLYEKDDTVDIQKFQHAQEELRLLDQQIKAVQTEKQLLSTLPLAPAKQSPAHARNLRHYRLLAMQANTLADEIESLQRQLAGERTRQMQLKKYSLNELQTMLLQVQSELKKPAEKAALKIPARHQSATLQPWRLLVSKQAVYVIGSNRMIRQGIYKNSQVKVTAFQFKGNEFYCIVKRHGHGIDHQQLSFQAIAPAGDISKYFIELLVEPDAIAQCAWPLRQLRAKQMLYNWRTVPADGAVLRSGKIGGKYEVSY